MGNLSYETPAGLDFLGGLSEPNLDYAFHMLNVWREKATGDLLWAEDSGCSCPSPFENYHWTPESTNLNRSKEELRRAITAFPDDAIAKRTLRVAAGLPL
jgi:hypothetical protein